MLLSTECRAGGCHIPLRLSEPGLQHQCFAQICSLKTITHHMKKVELVLGLVSPGPVGHFPLFAALEFAQLCPAQAVQHSVSQKCARCLDARHSGKVMGVAAQAKQQWYRWSPSPMHLLPTLLEDGPWGHVASGR